MCEASKALKSLEFAKRGDDITIVSGGYLAEFGRLFARSDGCIVCVPFGTTLQFTTLPENLQRRLNVGWAVEAVMVSPNDTMERSHENRDDEFVLKTNAKKRFHLRELPVGTQCRVINVPVAISDERPKQTAKATTAPQPVREQTTRLTA